MPGETAEKPPRRGLWAPSLTVIGMPLIALGLLGLLSRLEIVSNASLRIDAAVVLVFLASTWCLLFDWRLGLGMLGGSIVAYLAAVALPLWLAIALLILGCAFDLLGSRAIGVRP